MNTVASKGGHRHFENDVSLITNKQIFTVIPLVKFPKAPIPLPIPPSDPISTPPPRPYHKLLNTVIGSLLAD
jgi:hypothetical protein